jgi:hypothetical protein
MPIDEPEIKLPLGAVVRDVHGMPWVFVGCRQTTTSLNLEFVAGGLHFHHGERHSYRATHRATLIQKFPAIEKAEIK